MKYAVVDLGGDMAPLDLRFYAAAQEIQLRRDYAAHYDGDGVDDEVRAIIPGAPALASDEFPLRLHATVPADKAGDGAIGEHGLDGADIYRDLATKYGDAWTSVASHEALEARRDRRLHGCIELDNGTIIDTEVCDRCEADTYTIDVTIDGETRSVVVSNFNTASAFEPNPAAPQPEVYDHMNLSTAPDQVRPGGYAQSLVPGQGWVQRGQMRGYRQELSDRGLSRNAKREARRAALRAP